MTDAWAATVTVEIILNGIRVPVVLDEAAVAAIAAAITPTTESEPEFVTPVEAAEILRTTRGAIDHLLSAGKLRRYKRGSRVLIARRDVQELIQADPRRRR